MGKLLKIRDVVRITRLSANTIRHYIDTGELEAHMVDEGPGRHYWGVWEEDLYSCEAETIQLSLNPKEVKKQLSKYEQVLSKYDHARSDIKRLKQEAHEREDTISDLRSKLRDQDDLRAREHRAWEDKENVLLGRIKKLETKVKSLSKQKDQATAEATRTKEKYQKTLDSLGKAFTSLFENIPRRRIRFFLMLLDYQGIEAIHTQRKDSNVWEITYKFGNVVFDGGQVSTNDTKGLGRYIRDLLEQERHENEHSR